ncbi:unnamed protein product, partial [marine sediment metagenome]
LPSGVFYYLAFWNTLYSPGLNSIFRLMEKVNLKTFLFPLILFIIIFLLIRAKTNKLKKASLPVAIATTGFAGMAFQLIIILTFQSFYGNIYHRIGLLATAFMAGLALGSIVINNIMERVKNKLSLLIKLEVAIVLYSVCLPFFVDLFSFTSREALGIFLGSSYAAFIKFNFWNLSGGRISFSE